MATVRALKRMRRHGFTLRLVGNDLAISPFSSLSDAQRQFIRAHKVALVAWSGDMSQLSARLGICESILTARLKAIAQTQSGSRLVVNANPANIGPIFAALVRRMNKGEGS